MNVPKQPVLPVQPAWTRWIENVFSEKTNTWPVEAGVEVGTVYETVCSKKINTPVTHVTSFQPTGRLWMCAVGDKNDNNNALAL